MKTKKIVTLVAVIVLFIGGIALAVTSEDTTSTHRKLNFTKTSLLMMDLTFTFQCAPIFLITENASISLKVIWMRTQHMETAESLNFIIKEVMNL